MVKRFVAFGSAMLLAFSLSVCSFAATNRSEIIMGFPFFTTVNLRRAFDSNYIYQSTRGSRPVSGVSSDISSNISTGSMFVIDFVLGGVFTETNTYRNDFTYQVPSYAYIEPSSGTSQLISGHTNSSGDFTGYINSLYTVEYTTQRVTGFSDNSEQIVLINTSISGGDYAITGFFELPPNTIESIDQLFTSKATSTVFVGSESDPVSVDVSDIRFNLSSAARQVVQFMAVINIPESVSSMSSGRVQLCLMTNSGVSAPLTRFGVNTGGFEYVDTVSGIGGLSAQLANWFSGLKSQFGGIAQLLRLQQDDAQQAASEADNVAVSEASSAVQEIYQFEESLTSGISSGVSDIDFAIPSATGFVSALAAISFVMTSIFNGLGVYQFIITIPLILGIVLLLLGRGLQAVGRAQDIAVFAGRRSDRRGGG